MLAPLLLDIRQRLGWTLRQHATELQKSGYKVAHQTLSKWERQKGNPCSPDFICALFKSYESAATEHNNSGKPPIPEKLNALDLGNSMMSVVNDWKVTRG
jgi:transcriptional regulator with XRE-family HTH domain